MLRDPLGIWSHHLTIQEEFTVGITSVTRRARYYTIWTYYWENLHKEGIISPSDFEKIFILASIAHHDGNSQVTDLQHMYNNQKFADSWNDTEQFDLNFDINGFGWTYYNRQMEVFRCAWSDEFNILHTSSINSKLSNSLNNINKDHFKNKVFSKTNLREMFDGLCVCQICENETEVDILSKLMFGFFTEENNWDIDENEFKQFLNGDCKLTFIDKPHIRDYTQNYYSISEQNLRRRNTLFLFLKILSETSPNVNQIQQYIWDAIYFKQNTLTKEIISFGKLEQVLEYWEWHQLNVFYVYLIEKLLELVQKIVNQNVGISKYQLTNTLNHESLYEHLNSRLEAPIDEKTSFNELINSLSLIIGDNKRSSLDSKINESQVFHNLKGGSNEFIISEAMIMLFLLYIRYQQNSKFVPKKSGDNEFSINILNIDELFALISEKKAELTIVSFTAYLFKTIINRHLLKSAERFANGTRNWIFTEEENRLYPARDPIHTSARDNRWSSIRTLLLDLQFIEKDENNLIISKKGRLWLERIQLT